MNREGQNVQKILAFKRQKVAGKINRRCKKKCKKGSKMQIKNLKKRFISAAQCSIAPKEYHIELDKYTNAYFFCILCIFGVFLHYILHFFTFLRNFAFLDRFLGNCCIFLDYLLDYLLEVLHLWGFWTLNLSLSYYKKWKSDILTVRCKRSQHNSHLTDPDNIV